jgi:hypothetical protein
VRAENRSKSDAERQGCKINMRRCGEEKMDDPISPTRRTLLKAGAATLATPVAAPIAHRSSQGFTGFLSRS